LPKEIHLTGKDKNRLKRLKEDIPTKWSPKARKSSYTHL
jgi:hypothetical protein